MPTSGPIIQWPRLKDDTLKYISKIFRKGSRRRVIDQVYQPLKTSTCIRLLELLPGHDSDPIRCRLQITNSENTPEYEALSYAWGDPNNKQEIECGDGKVNVPINLHALLRRIRDPVKTRRLWADAICINQSNLEEVGHQVKQMGTIYSSAQRVIIWLGSEDPFDSWSKDEQPSTIIRQCLERSNSQNILNTSFLNDIQSITHLDLKRIVSALSFLFRQPWFKRLWVLQEAGLAKSGLVLFGPREIDYRELITFVQELRSRYRELIHGHGFPSRMQLASLYSKQYWDPDSWKAEKVDFLDLLEFSGTRYASDPRDYIFALLGHPSAKVNGTLLIEPDYRKTSWEICHEFAIKIIQQTQNLRVLSAVHHLDENIFGQEYPSWVPTWTRDRNGCSLGVHRRRYLEACAGVAGKICFVNTYKTLQVEGFAFDTVDECTSTIEFRPGFLRAAVLPIAAAVRFKDKLEMSTSDYLSELSMSLTPISHAKKNNSQKLKDFAAFRLHFSRNISDEENISPCDLIPEGDAAAERAASGGDLFDFCRDCATSASGKKLFITKSGLLGVGPEVLRSGDVCCILYGAFVPFILRPMELGYRLVGEACIGKVMQGEAVADLVLNAKYQEQVFDIF